MKRCSLFAALAFATALGSSLREAHPGHEPLVAGARVASGVHSTAPGDADGISGQGAMRFQVLYTSDRLPEKAREVLVSAHGGFAVDRRPGRGEVYFALPGVGLLRISADLQSIDLLETRPAMRDANLHNTTLWEASDGTHYLSFPANDEGRVFTTTLAGELVQTLEAPTGEVDLGHSSVNDYFRAGGKFHRPTSITFVACSMSPRGTRTWTGSSPRASAGPRPSRSVGTTSPSAAAAPSPVSSGPATA